MKRGRIRLTLFALMMVIPGSGCAELPPQAQESSTEFIRKMIAAFLF